MAARQASRNRLDRDDAAAQLSGGRFDPGDKALELLVGFREADDEDDGRLSRHLGMDVMAGSQLL